MASSGYASFTMSRDGLITASLRKLRVLNEAQQPSYFDLYTGNEAINILLKNWQVQGLILSLMQQIELPCVEGQTAYTLGPVGADLIIERPVRLYDGSFIRQTVDGVATDTPLEIISRQTYNQIVAKSVEAKTNQLYYFPGIDIAPAVPLYPTSPSIGWGTLYIFNPAVDASYTLYINVQRAVQDMINGGDEFDLPQEWFLPLVWGLAQQLADEYEVPEDRCNRLFKWSEYYRQQLQDWQKTLGDTNFAEERQQQERTFASEKPR